LGACLARLQPFSDLFGSQMGSNSWVLGPSRSKSGKPMLANDPHIAFTNPGVWYEAHLKYSDYDLYSHYVPLVPLPLLGHNRNFAWALTMFENDDLDLYREKFKPDNPARVMYKGGWVDVKVETETIHVRFGRDRHCAIRVTPHGPVITDMLRKLDGYEGADVALSWVWQHVPYEDMLGFYRMARARDCESFARGAALVTSPGLNISYADRAGNIAWWAAGKLPIRPGHVNPKRVLDGASGNDEILGYLPFDHNPHLVNPEQGYIVTANNMSTVKALGPIGQLQGYWQPSDRARRIEEMLGAKPAWSLDELRAVQFDDMSPTAADTLKPLLEILHRDTSAFSGLEKQALEILTRWDCRHNPESAGSAVYQVYLDALLRRSLLDEMGEKLFYGYAALADEWNFFKYFVNTPDSPFWDNITTPQRETREDIVRSSFHETVAELKKRCGPDAGRWTWGALHTMEFKHPFGYLPLLGRIFNIGPFPASGAADVVNNMLYSTGKYDFDVIAGPSTRRLIDSADPEHSLTILPTGNSGNFMSPHYADQAAMFMKGEYREPRLTQEQIEFHTQHEMTFAPAAKGY
jgi:penicillin amidase